MSANDKRRTLIIALIFILTLGVMGTLTYLQYQDKLGMEERIALKRREAAEARSKIAQIPALRAQATVLSERVDEYARILPKEHEVGHDAFVERIAQFAADLEIDILRADPIVKGAAAAQGDAPARQAFNEHSYHFELVGDFKNFLRFVNKIENWDRFLAVEEIEIRPLAARAASPHLAGGKDLEAAKGSRKSIVLVVTTYTYTAKERAAAVAASS